MVGTQAHYNRLVNYNVKKEQIITVTTLLRETSIDSLQFEDREVYFDEINLCLSNLFNIKVKGLTGTP